MVLKESYAFRSWYFDWSCSSASTRLPDSLLETWRSQREDILKFGLKMKKLGVYVRNNQKSPLSIIKWCSLWCYFGWYSDSCEQSSAIYEWTSPSGKGTKANLRRWTAARQDGYTPEIFRDGGQVLTVSLTDSSTGIWGPDVVVLQHWSWPLQFIRKG